MVRKRSGPYTSATVGGGSAASTSPRGAAVAMVIMSALSELTDTDGFEMHSGSQRAPCSPTPHPAGPRVCRAPLCRVSGYPRVTARPSSTAQPASSLLKGREMTGSMEARLTHFWTPSGAPLPPPKNLFLPPPPLT